MENLDIKYLNGKLKELETKIEDGFYDSFINQEEGKRQADYDRGQLDLIRILLGLKN